MNTTRPEMIVVGLLAAHLHSKALSLSYKYIMRQPLQQSTMAGSSRDAAPEDKERYCPAGISIVQHITQALKQSYVHDRQMIGVNTGSQRSAEC